MTGIDFFDKLKLRNDIIKDSKNSRFHLKDTASENDLFNAVFEIAEKAMKAEKSESESE